MSLSQMQVFNEYVMPVVMERLSQVLAVFNDASRGAISLSANGFTGDFAQRSFYQAIHSARRRVDRYAAQASATPTDLTQLKESDVKIAGGFGPIRYEPSQMTWLLKPTPEGIAVAAAQFAEAILQDYVNTAVSIAVAAVANQAAATNDVSASAGISYTGLNNTHAKFGDQSGQIVLNVMTGAVYHKLIGINLVNATGLFAAGNVTVVDILGKRTLVTDAPALYTAGSPNKARILGLQRGAVRIGGTGDIITNVQTNNGNTRIETTFQADYSFTAGLMGYTWDEANGGKSPIDSELSTGTNWDKTVTDIKQTAGVIFIANADT